MRISYNWLKQFIKLDWKSEETAALLTDLGLEVEGVEKFESLKGGLEGVVVGHVLTCVQHPNADRLRVTTVDLGDSTPVQIVCGAPNVAAGQKVPVATIGTTLYDKEGNSFQIKKGKIRGEDSHGMICAEDELGLGQGHDGIMVLGEDLKPGTPASKIFNIESDEIFEIGLTPNRADAMSHWGVARDLRAGLAQKNVHTELITPSVSNFRVDKRTLKIDVKVEDNKLAPRYCGVTISGITVKPSPAWLQNKLKAIGLTPKNNIVDVTNYVLHELGQPLHAFDAAKIKAEIEKALEQVDAAKIQAEIQKSMKDFDAEKIKKEIQESLKEIDAEKIKAEVDKALKEIDVNKINAEVQASLSKANMDKVKEEMQRLKEIDFKKIEEELKRIKPEIEKSLAEARVGFEKAKEELTAYKNFIDGLDRDGLIDKDKSYTIEYKDGALTINGKKQPAATTNKYSNFLKEKKNFTIKKDEDDFNIDND